MSSKKELMEENETLRSKNQKLTVALTQADIILKKWSKDNPELAEDIKLHGLETSGSYLWIPSTEKARKAFEDLEPKPSMRMPWAYPYLSGSWVTDELRKAAAKDSTENHSSETDVVNHPSHYTSGEIECIDAIKASMGEHEFKGYLRGNVMKYIWRYQHKNGQEDLNKAMWYLNRLIENNKPRPAN